MSWRINILLSIAIILGAAIISRLFYLQVIEHKLFEAQALGQQASFNKITGSRGEVFCESSQKTKGAEGSGSVKSLAINRDSWTISATIKDIADKNIFAETLSKNISQTKDVILSKLESGDDYVSIEKGLTNAQVDKIKLLKLKGLYFQNEPERFYPQEKLASQILGFLGGSGSGQYGIEGFYDDILKGKSGISESKKGLNSILSGNEESLNGSNIYLTLDYNIQFQAESLLKKVKDKLEIESGQIIVMKPDSGRVLAMANFPAFNPNEYSKEKNLDVFQNAITQKLFEPGSIMKPFTMASAINEGKITPDTTYVDTGILKFGTKAIHNFANEVYGKQTMTQVLENSINTGAVFAQQQITHDIFFNYIEKFGFTYKTGIDLQAETYSRNESLKNGPDMNFATASFGQGIVVTPIQIAAAFCSIANGGKLVKPYMVEKIVNGKDEAYTKKENFEQIISNQTTSQLNSMLINVVDKGFNSVAKIPGYYLAGKTGTAQIPAPNGKGYLPDNNTIQSFVGYGPALNPQFLILVKLDNPKVPKSSLSAVPVFKELAQYIINYWQIPPDYDATKKVDVKK